MKYLLIPHNARYSRDEDGKFHTWKVIMANWDDSPGFRADGRTRTWATEEEARADIAKRKRNWPALLQHIVTENVEEFTDDPSASEIDGSGVAG
jgi:hypothetical protein